MKRLLFYLLILSIASVNLIYAESEDDFSNIDQMIENQRNIPNQDYQDVVEALEEKKNQIEEKELKKKQKKIVGSGSTLHIVPDNSVGDKEILNIKLNEDGTVLNLPVQLVVNEIVLEKGYYKVLPEVNDDSGEKYVNLYQSEALKAKVKMIVTDDDFEKDLLDFAEIIPIDDFYAKLIFGSLEFNGYVILPYVN